MVKEKAYAKVNLFLNVLDKRKDGFHNLFMLNAKIDLYDTLTFKKLDDVNAVIIKSNDLFLSNEDNIVLQTANHMLKTYNIKSGLEITIDKKIPFGAGLAGNSADSAAVIKGIDSLFSLTLTPEEMKNIGFIFGADIPYCLTDKPAFVSGIGEVVEEIDLNLDDYQILLMNPKEYVNTKDIFELGDKVGYALGDSTAIKEIVKINDIEKLKMNLFNSLESITVNQYPIIKEFKDLIINELGLNGLIMTGSGSTFIKLINKGESFFDFISKYQHKYLINIYDFR